MDAHIATEQPTSRSIPRSERTLRAGGAEATRAVLLAAAAELLQEVGYGGLSLRQLAERSGYAATAIYRHFDGKDALIAALTADGFAELGRRLEEAAARGQAPSMRLRRAMLAYIAFAYEAPAVYEIMFLWRSGSQEACIADGRTRVAECLRALVAAALAGQQTPVCSALTVADALLAQLHGLVAMGLWLPPSERPRIEAATEAALALLRRALERPEPPVLQALSA